MKTSTSIASQNSSTSASAWPIVAPSGISISKFLSTNRARPTKATSFSNNIITGMDALPLHRAAQGCDQRVACIIATRTDVSIGPSGIPIISRKSAETKVAGEKP